MTKSDWAIVWAIFSQNPLVTLNNYLRWTGLTRNSGRTKITETGSVKKDTVCKFTTSDRNRVQYYDFKDILPNKSSNMVFMTQNKKERSMTLIFKIIANFFAENRLESAKK
jgi:hypothetical protein